LEISHFEEQEGRYEDNIKIDLRVMGCEVGTWMGLAPDHVQWWALILVTMLIIWVLQLVS